MPRNTLRTAINGLLGFGLFVILASSAAASMTASDYGIGLADDVAAVVPLPPGLTIGGQRQVLSTYYVNFTFDRPWAEVLEFFSTRLASDGWEIVREVPPEQSTGPRQAAWIATGHGVDLSIDLQTSGRAEGERSVGVMQVRPARE